MKKNKLLIISILLLTIFGIIMIYSSSCIWAEYKYNDPYKYLKLQFLFLCLSYLATYIVSKINYQYYKKYSNIILFICVFLLILVLIPSIGTIRNGSRSWFGVGSFGIQPSEFTKLGIIIFASKYLNNNKIKSIKSSIFPLLLIVILIFGLIMLQPDFGTGIIIIISIIALLFISGVKLSFFIKLAIIGIIGIIALIIIAPYRLERITSFINPWNDPLGSGFQIIQSLYSIGPGGLLGMGLGNSIQKHFYLPEPQTDFIFSIISEELGFLGVILVTTLFIIIIKLCFDISIKQVDNFAKYLSFGISFNIGFQAILNLMVVIGLLPVTGVTLPFLSYGGSSLLISMIGIGIILNISKNNSDIY